MPAKGSLRGRVKPQIGETGRKSEAIVAKKFGGRLTRASGNMAGDKGDFELPEFLVEAKATENGSYSISHDTLAKIAREAVEKQKRPALHLTFATANGRPKPLGSWIMIPADLFEAIQSIYAERV